ncbi:30S ribosomal protein S5 [Candidatus Uhrbacteria bacterium]|nr:30S ribosomal protein S5 [Candidatus Uhrbacteria bacterium]
MNEQQSTNQPTSAASTKRPARAGGRGGRGGSGGGNRRGGSDGGERKGRARGKTQQVREYEQKILDLARVTRVTAGGKRMSFRAALVIGDKKGKVGFGIAKGSDVQIAVEKAYRQAKKNVITVPMQNETIPHAVWVKEGSAIVLLKPAPKGTGLKSGGAVRMVLEYAGVPNVVSRILNSSNKINIARATFSAIQQFGKQEKKVVKDIETKEIE